MDFFFVDYWPWWLSAIAFSVVTVGMWMIERRLLGVSGSYTAAVSPIDESKKKLDDLERDDPAAIEDALLRATLEEFGPEAVEAFQQAMADETPPDSPVFQPRHEVSRHAHWTFLAMLVVGGALGSVLTGRWELRTDLGALHELLTGGGATSIAVLAVGGFLVGFGTRMAGGCTSGHGLSGCSRLQPGSLVATASFFGTAVGVSFLLEALIK